MPAKPRKPKSRPDIPPEPSKSLSSDPGANSGPRIGRPPKITMEVVQAISLMVARGMPLEMACLADGVLERSFRAALERKTVFMREYHAGQARWMKMAMNRLESGEKYISGLQFLLERRHGKLFRRPREDTVAIPPGAMVLPAAQVEQLRQLAATALATKPAKVVEIDTLAGSQPVKNE